MTSSDEERPPIKDLRALAPYIVREREKSLWEDSRSGCDWDDQCFASRWLDMSVDKERVPAQREVADSEWENSFPEPNLIPYDDYDSYEDAVDAILTRFREDALRGDVNAQRFFAFIHKIGFYVESSPEETVRWIQIINSVYEI